MAVMTRTDIHRPSAPEFDPEGYEFFACFDLSPEWGTPGRQALVSTLVDEGWSFRGAPHGSGQCSHCGARIRYAALMGHTATKTLLYIGETCLDNRFSLTKVEFDRLRKEARLNAEQATKRERIEALLTEYPNLVWASYAHNIDVAGGVRYYYAEWDGQEFDTEEEAQAAIATLRNPEWATPGYGFKRGTTWGEKTRTGWETSTLQDIWSKVERYGQVSPRQAEFVENLVTRLTEKDEALQARQAEAAAKAAAGVEVPTGRVVVEGEVVSTKWVDNGFGSQQKMLVVTDEGWKVFGSVPSSIDVEKGTRVRFTATVEQSRDDSLFGFFKRPTKAETI